MREETRNFSFRYKLMKTKIDFSHIFMVATLLLILSCKSGSDQPVLLDNSYATKAVDDLTQIIIHDIFSPPQAARIYAYTTIAGFEAARFGAPALTSLAGQLRDFGSVPAPDKETEINFDLAGLEAAYTTGKALIFSEATLEEKKAAAYQKIKTNTKLSNKVWKNSLAFGQQVAAHVLAWADKDNYKQTRTFPKYSIQDNPATWKPTPPSYMQGIEPSWREIRPFVLDSAQQFKPIAPTPFDTKEDSKFFKEVMEVYLTGKNLTDEQKAIANFWDCNPYVTHQTGHVMFATKKITPGGHWMGIASQACLQAGKSYVETSQILAITAITLSDGFISCWDEKYRSVLVRPETVINTHIDETWAPLLQTPPFPEYTSGHSVISSAASVALTNIFGDNFAYVDSVEVPYGLPPRSFKSFYQAADEASISRLYGGIHYMPAITEGVKQGKNVGALISARIKLRE